MTWTWVPVAVAVDRRGKRMHRRPGGSIVGIFGWGRTRGLVCGLLASGGGGLVVVDRAGRPFSFHGIWER